MSHPARSALVLQGGRALGAYELGAARALAGSSGFVTLTFPRWSQSAEDPRGAVIY
jgi:predicted acylesterase/phospholipase RssA